MNESEGDIASLGILALRHHDKSDVRGQAFTFKDRLLNYAAVFESLNQDSLLTFRPTTETFGPLLGGIMVPPDAETDRKMTEWSWAWPVKVTETPGDGSQGSDSFKLKPAHKVSAKGWELSSPDTDKLGAFVARSPDGRAYPKGFPGVVVAASDLASQQACFSPSGGTLVAPHRGGRKRHGTLVHDVTEADELDETRAAHLQSLVRTFKIPPGGLYGADTSDSGLAIHLELVRKGGMSGRGVFAGFPKGQSSGVAVSLPGDNARQTLAASSYVLGGPFCVGSGAADKHAQPSNADGDVFGPLHLDVNTLWHLNNAVDAPNKHSGRFPRVGEPKGKPIEVFWAYDPDDTHSLPTGTFQGKHKWYTLSPVYPVLPPTTVQDPTFVVPPNNPTTVVIPDPPTTGGGGDRTTGGGDGSSTTVEFPGLDELIQRLIDDGGSTDGGPTSGGGDVPIAGQTRPDDITSPGGVVYSGPEGTPGPSIDVRGPGGLQAVFEVSPAGVPAIKLDGGPTIQDVLDTLNSGGVLRTGSLPSGGDTLDGEAYVASTAPFAAPSILARPIHTAIQSSRADYDDATLAQIDQTSPIVVRFEPSGAQVDDGWDYTTNPGGGGSFPGGTAAGILWTLTPEQTLIMALDGEEPPVSSESGLGFASGTFVGFGTPLKSGGLGSGVKMQLSDAGEVEVVSTDEDGTVLCVSTRWIECGFVLPQEDEASLPTPDYAGQITVHTGGTGKAYIALNV